MPLSLAEANEYVRAHVPHPDAPFIPVGDGCDLLRTAHEFGVGNVAIALAASYFQRLLFTQGLYNETPTQRMLADRVFDGVVMCTRRDGDAPTFEAPATALATFEVPVPGDPQALSPLIIYAVCLHIAVKATHVPKCTPEDVRRHGGYILHNFIVRMLNVSVSKDQMDFLWDLEAWVLRRFDYRMQPLTSPIAAAAEQPRRQTKRKRVECSPSPSPTTVMDVEAMSSPSM